MLRVETFYRYQIMLRDRRMSAVSKRLALVQGKLALPEDITLSIDIDPAGLG